MRLLSWNYQRVGNSWTVGSLHKLVRDQAPIACFLMETRLDREGFDNHCRELPFLNKFVVKKPNGGDGLAWMLTCFYGWPEASQKHKSWVLLNHLYSFVDGPWCCIGDFNAILHSSEKQSRFPPPFKQMDEFHSLLDGHSLADLGFVGYPYTWNNK